MQIIHKLLDYTTPWQKPDVYLFTGNSVIKNNGAIVMGRGAALQVRDTFLGIDKIFGKLLTQTRIDEIYDPSILFHEIKPKQFIGWFKVKHHWADKADINLIEMSIRSLYAYAQDLPKITFHMNYPGIGNGRLAENDVKALIVALPNNVIIYK